MSQQLSRDARRLIVGVVVGTFGTGLVLPFRLVYLHEVRAIPLATTGLLLAVPGVVGLVVVPVSGALSDRFGATRVLQTALVLIAASDLALAAAHTALQALPGLVLLGAMGAPFPALSALMARLAPDPTAQQRLFAISFTAVNAAIGIGGLVAGLVVDLHRPATLVMLLCGDAAANLVQALLVATLPAPLRRAAPRKAEPGELPASYRRVLADPLVRRLAVQSLLVALIGYAALDSGLPAFARVVAGVSPRVVALSYTVNTVVIVGAQLGVLRMLAGRRRSRALAGVGLIWALSWATLGLSGLFGLVSGGGTRTALVLVAAAVFGLGETLLSTSSGPLLNAVAHDAVRGRVNALGASMNAAAFVVSPALSATLIGAHAAAVWIGGLIAGGLTVAVLAVRLGSALTPEQDGVQAPATGSPRLAVGAIE